MKREFILIAILFLIAESRLFSIEPKPIKLLILSGKNNHEWQKTTPVLLKMYENAGLFTAETTESPDTLKHKDYKRFDVILSNWNTWPDNAFRFPESWENDFVRYIKEGGGMLFIHAGASSFYGWDDYHRIGIGRWGKETKHGKITKGFVSGFDQKHPVTKGLKDFTLTDEIWEKTDIFPGSKALATVTATDEKDGHSIKESAVFVSSFGKGRSFYTTLGHDERALQAPVLQELILRATQWAAGKKITIK